MSEIDERAEMKAAVEYGKHNRGISPNMYAFTKALEAYEFVRQQDTLEVQTLLMDMRCQVVYSHVATMPIPLYERIKALIQQMEGR